MPPQELASTFKIRSRRRTVTVTCDGLYKLDRTTRQRIIAAANLQGMTAKLPGPNSRKCSMSFREKRGYRHRRPRLKLSLQQRVECVLIDFAAQLRSSVHAPVATSKLVQAA